MTARGMVTPTRIFVPEVRSDGALVDFDARAAVARVALFVIGVCVMVDTETSGVLVVTEICVVVSVDSETEIMITVSGLGVEVKLLLAAFSAAITARKDVISQARKFCAGVGRASSQAGVGPSNISSSWEVPAAPLSGEYVAGIADWSSDWR
jgi:hypothetical protein